MAADELTQVILSDLRESKRWQNDASTLLREIAERLAKVETQLAEVKKQQEEQKDNVDELESMKDRGTGAKNILGYIIASFPGLIALYQMLIKSGGQ